MKMCLPGPYTFILKANKKIPGYFQSKKKTVGIRIVNHKIPTTIVEMLGNPILTTSLRDQEDEILEYKTDPELIYERYKKLVDIVINGGYGNNIPSTILDCSNENGEITLIRQGLGETHFITFNDED
jgi:tRNA threonylcarbamoyl adenosine modification protein (Sua5/YciO/YrdC/YwlC family)